VTRLVTDPGDTAIILWRRTQFVRMGLDEEDSELLASRLDVDTGMCRKLLQTGCSHTDLLRIMT
jgi:hypothetical protein